MPETKADLQRERYANMTPEEKLAWSERARGYHLRRKASRGAEQIEMDRERSRKATRKHYAELTPEQRAHKLQSAREFRASRPEKQRAIRRRAHLKRAYGITPEQYESIFQAQGCSCAICKTTEPGSKKGWHIDHCHATGKVRGILCHHCNLTVGHAKDDEQRLIDAVFYILQHREAASCPRS